MSILLSHTLQSTRTYYVRGSQFGLYHYVYSLSTYIILTVIHISNMVPTEIVWPHALIGVGTYTAILTDCAAFWFFL